jgi:hypothetical protein
MAILLISPLSSPEKKMLRMNINSAHVLNCEPRFGQVDPPPDVGLLAETSILFLNFSPPS